jgi:hypothetical protein
VDYNFALAKVKINLGSLTKELKSSSFVILMSLGVSKGRLQLKGARQPPQCILNSFNKFLEVFIKMNFLIFFHLIKWVDHQIKMVPRSTPSSKAPYELNQKELK